MNQVSIDERVQYTEEIIESPRHLIIERLQTEINDIEQENFETEVKEELCIWSVYGIFVLNVCILLELRRFYGFNLMYAFFPLAVLEGMMVLFYLAKVLMKKDVSKEVLKSLVSLGNLIFWVLLLVYLKSGSFNFVLLTLPLVFPTFLTMFIKTKNLNNCSSFSSHLYLIFRWIKILTVLFIGLKLERYTDWPWFGILWPIWISLGFLYVASAFIIGITIGSICSYIYKSTIIYVIISNIWLLYTTTGGALTITISLINLLKNNEKFLFLWIIFYLLFFVIGTFSLLNTLAQWWVSLFYEQEEFSIPSNSASNANSLPASRSTTLRNSRKMIKLPPKILQRMTSNYFMPFEEHKKIQKTLSDDFGLRKELSHVRKYSLPGQEIIPTHSYTPSESSYIEKKCEICLEHNCDAVLMDCGHGGLCILCAEILFESKGKCHMCRAEISQVLKIKLKNSKIAKVVGVK